MPFNEGLIFSLLLSALLTAPLSRPLFPAAGQAGGPAESSGASLALWALTVRRYSGTLVVRSTYLVTETLERLVGSGCKHGIMNYELCRLMKSVFPCLLGLSFRPLHLLVSGLFFCTSCTHLSYIC